MGSDHVFYHLKMLFDAPLPIRWHILLNSLWNDTRKSAKVGMNLRLMIPFP